MENPSCMSTPPDTLLSLLWTTIAVFGIVYAILGYRCLRAVGFLSGLAVGAGCVIGLQSQGIEVINNQVDSGRFTSSYSSFLRFHRWFCHLLLFHFSVSNGCWTIRCCIRLNTSNSFCIGVCVCRCYHKWIDNNILHCNTSKSHIRRKCQNHISISDHFHLAKINLINCL